MLWSQWSRTLTRIMSSSSVIQNSTPEMFGSTGTDNGIISFSRLIISVIKLFSPNFTRLIPSKHFFKWGCTLVTSFVCERMDRSSSLDKKKNRVKMLRLDSKYADKPFCTRSNNLLPVSIKLL